MTPQIDESGFGVGEFSAGSTSYGADSELKIAVVEGSYVVSDSGLFTFKASDFKNPTGERPGQRPGLSDRRGRAARRRQPRPDGPLQSCRRRSPGEDAFNAFIEPLIEQYGYLDNGVRTGGGSVGVDYHSTLKDFFNKSFQVGYDHYIGKHELHIGYRSEQGEEDLYRTANGWGLIYVPGGIDPEWGEDVYYRAQFWQQSLSDEVPTIHSELETQSIELNDQIRLKDWTLNIGLVFSNDTLYGQGLKKNSSNVSGFELCADCIYEMKMSASAR